MTSDQLKRRLRGSLIPVIHPARRAGVDREAATRRHTTLIVRAADVGDIREAVRYAHENGARVALRQCRRALAGTEPQPDVVIDISALNTHRIDTTTLQARVEPCASVPQLVAALDRRNLGFPFPRHTSASIAGCLLGSDTPQTPQEQEAAWGAVIAMDVVREDGSVVTVDAPKGGTGADLRNAGMAAGGIVTAFRLRLRAKASFASHAGNRGSLDMPEAVSA